MDISLSKKTDSKFSLMEIDQIHEQNNAVMKDMGGATSLLNILDESSLARWGLCINELASIAVTTENDVNSLHEAQRHRKRLSGTLLH